jgi:mRNA interferase HigB
VNIIARKALREFWEKHAQAETPMKLLYSRLESRDWEGPQDIKYDKINPETI